MPKEREINIKIIKNNKISMNRLTEFFARKYSEKRCKEQRIKS